MGRLMLWTIPRSKSTITLRILTNNSESKAIFEPFPFAYFSKYYDDVFTYQHLWEYMKEEPFTSDNCIWKDVPDFVQNHDFDKWVADKSVKHVMLIRNPRDVCLSKVTLQGNPMFFMNVPKQLAEHPTVPQNFETMAKLLDHLKTNAFHHKVVQAEDLTKEQGEDMIRGICEFAQLPFESNMLELSAIEEFPETWWLPPCASSKVFKEGVCFHENALGATSLKSGTAHTQVEDSQLSDVDRATLYEYEDVREAMSKEPFTDDNIVWKDVADCVENHDFETWVTDKSFKHVLLIRNPVDVAMSTVGYKGQPVRFMNWPSYYPTHPSVEDSFRVMVKLRDYLHKNGFDYKVFDSEALNSSTGLEFVKSICDFGQIPFEESMLTLKSSDKFPETWWIPPTAHLLSDSSGLDLDFHGNACKSTSLEPVRTITHDPGEELSEDERLKLETIRSNVMPCYKYLKTALQ